MVPTKRPFNRWIPIFVIAFVVATLAALAADVFVGTPPFNPDPGEQVVIELLVDVGPDVLGSFFVDFDYDPGVVHIASISGGTTPEFSSAPATNPTTFDSGVTPLAAAQGDITSPTGFVSVATVTLQAVGLPGDGSDLDLAVHSLFDADLNALPATVFPSSVLIDLPLAASDLVFQDATNMSWTASPHIGLYNVYRGDFDATPFAFDHTCLEPERITPTAVDADTPASSGEGFYYLVSAERNQVEGSLGVTSFGQTRPNLFPCVGARASMSDGPAPRHLQIVIENPADRSTGPSRTVHLASDGDVDGNGALSAADADAILQSVVGTRELSVAAEHQADVDGDGDIDVGDAQLLRQFLTASGTIPRAQGTGFGPGMSVVLGSADCSPVDFAAGLNAARLRCLPDGYTAFEMLKDLGGEGTVSAIQRFDPISNRYLTATYVDGQAAGDDFPVLPVESYLIQIHKVRRGFVPALVGSME